VQSNHEASNCSTGRSCCSAAGFHGAESPLARGPAPPLRSQRTLISARSPGARNAAGSFVGPTARLSSHGLADPLAQPIGNAAIAPADLRRCVSVMRPRKPTRSLRLIYMRRGWPLVELAGAGLDLPPASTGLAPAGFEQGAGQGPIQAIDTSSTTTNPSQRVLAMAAEASPVSSQQAIARVVQECPASARQLSLWQRGERLDRLFEPCRRFSLLGR